MSTVYFELHFASLSHGVGHHEWQAPNLFRGGIRALMINKPPAFQFYAKDYLSSPRVRMMSLEAEGAYIHLIATAWDNSPVGTLPPDLESLRLLCRADKEQWEKIWPQIESQFPLRRGRRENSRLREEYRGQLLRRTAKQIAGKAGASAKWNNKLNGTTMILPMAKDGSASATASATASANLKDKHRAAEPAAFILPEWVPREEWDGYEEMRRKIKKPMTNLARKKAVEKLAELHVLGNLPKSVLGQSVFNSWQGLFPISSSSSTSTLIDFEGLREQRGRERTNEIFDRAFGRKS